MKKYLKLNTLYYTISFRLRKHRETAASYTDRQMIVPHILNLSIAAAIKQKEDIEKELFAMEDRFANMLPSQLINEMIYENKIINW